MSTSVFSGRTGASVINQARSESRCLAGRPRETVVLKYTPHLVFHLDDSIERGARVIEIMQEIESTSENKAEASATPQFAEIGAVAARSTTDFAVLSHVRPDGDALGSQIALAFHCGSWARR